MFDRLMDAAFDLCKLAGMIVGLCVAVWLFATGDGWNERFIGVAVGIFSGQAAVLFFAALVVCLALLHLWVWVPIAQAIADLKPLWAAIHPPCRKP